MTMPAWSRRSRIRKLASDNRSGRFARRKYRAAYRAYLRNFWRYLAAAAFASLGITAIVAAIVRGEFARGLVVGFGAAATAAALSQWVVLASGVGPAYMGETAERWTASELRRLQRTGWRVINHFSLTYGDVDHVVIGPAGVFVIETKWSAFGWKEKGADDSVRAAVRQVEKSTARLLKTVDYGRLGLPAPRTCVVLWGDGATELTKRLKQPTVLAGSEITDRITAFSLIHSRLTPAEIDGGWHMLSEHLRTHDDQENDDQPVPASIQELVLRFLGGVVAGLVGFVAAADLLKLHMAWWMWALVTVVAAGVAQPLRRWGRLRPAITGWQAGLVATLLLAAALEGHQILR